MPEMPELDVTRAQFAEEARKAHWDEPVIAMFLADVGPRRHLICNRKLLRITDWPAQPPRGPREMDRARRRKKELVR